MSLRLRDLIKAVRACKTAQEERELVAKESAIIRTQIANENEELRPRNVAKLLFINMLGYSTSWGQMECLKLVVSPNYADKRIGYLGLMVLLDENQEVLMLVTNSLKNDLSHRNQYIVGLALCALGNISSPSIARDTASDVEKLLGSSNPYLRKKASLCALRILRKVPDLMDSFVPRIKTLLTSKNHGVLITAVTLMIELARLEQGTNIEYFRQLVPQLVRVQRHLCQSGYAPEYDISGVTDPFLQVKILRALRILGEGHFATSELMNDLLAQVATNTDHVRNVGNAVLYECVQTIMSIKAESGLRVLAINVLGRFLANRDNNIRYVALNTLCRVIVTDPEAVQRHRNTIVDCLKDNDVSIRKRALELIYSLVNENNVRALVRELLNYLTIADVDSRAELTAKLCLVTQKYAPTKRWLCDTILKIMQVSGNFVGDEVSSHLIALIANTPDLQSYAVQKMYLALQKDLSQHALTKVGVWCIGEYGKELLNQNDSEGKSVQEDDVIDLLQRIMRSPMTKSSTKIYVLTCFMKLSSRFLSCTQDLKDLIQSYQSDLNLELQSRACEFSKIFSWDSIRQELLAPMPAPELKSIAMDSPLPPRQTSVKAPKGVEDNNGDVDSGNKSESGKKVEVKPVETKKNSLIDFDDEEEIVEPSGGGATGGSENTMDVLNQILMNANSGSSPKVEQNGSNSNGSDLLGGLLTPSNVSSTQNTGYGSPQLNRSGSPSMQQNSQQVKYPSFVCFQKDGLTVSFECVKQRHQPQFTLVNASFRNSAKDSINNFQMQCAVPVYIKLALDSASGTEIPPLNQGTITQSIKLANSQHGVKPVVMKLKLNWSSNGSNFEHLADVNFPPGV